MVTACYIVMYYVTDFPMGEEPVRHEDAYRSYDNALLVAKDLAKCLDVVDDVYIIDGLTGEVINAILKDKPQEDTTMPPPLLTVLMMGLAVYGDSLRIINGIMIVRA